MKKVFLSVLFVSLAWAALSQPIIARSGPANTVQDARATWLYNAFLPRFADTTAANVQKGIDSCGAVIYTYDINGLWFRQCSPKKWIMLNNSSPYSSSGWNVGGNLFPVTVIPSRNIGTLAPYGGAIGLMTNSVTQMIIPDAGINRQSGGAYKYLLIDTITRETGYGDGGGSSSSLRFGVSGEDVIATASRSFNQNGYDFTYTGDGLFKLNSGISTSTAKLQIGRNSASAFAPDLAVGEMMVNNIHATFLWRDTVTAANLSSIPLQGIQMNRYLVQGDNNLNIEFKNGASFGLILTTKDSTVLNPEGGDAVNGLSGGIYFRKREDQTTRTAIQTGIHNRSLGYGIDPANGIISSLNVQGGSGTNNFHLYGDYAAFMAYQACTNTTDTIDNYYGYATFGSGNAHFNHVYNFYGSGVGGGVDTLHGIYMTGEDYNYLSNGLRIGAGSSGIQDASSMLDIVSTTKGVLFPRMTATQRVAISSPANSLLAWDTDSSRYMVNVGGTWKGLKYTDEGTDTTSISNRINLKLNISDTATMLTNYVNGVGYALLKSGQVIRADSATLANYFLRRKDSATGTNLNGYLTRSSVGAYSPTWQQALTTGSTLTGNNTIAGGAYNFTFGNMGLFTISQNAKASVSGTNGTAHVSPLTITGGAGGASSYSTGTVLGGNAGVINITGGNGGNITGTPTTGVGGTGADINLTAGDGGLGTTNGGTAGVINIAAGTGGQGTSGGSAGYVSIKGGFAGTSTNSDGGHIYLSPGQKQGSGLDGHIFLGISPSGAVRGAATIGSATRGDSLFNIKDGGLYADRGIQFPNIPSGTKDDSLVVKGSTGTIKYINTGDFTRQQDTISLASFGGGGGQAGDTTTFSTSTIYGSFYNDGSDTLVITSIRAVLQGSSPSLVPTVYFNDSLNVTAGATKLVNSPATLTNTATGASATPDNKKIPPGVWVWVKTETVTTKPTYFSLTILGYKKRR